MDLYEIIITPDAAEDLKELRDYIAYELLSPETALKYIRILRKEISALGFMPGRTAPVQEEPWHTYGVRRILAKNFFIYYRIDETEKRVYILNIIYAHRDQLARLADIDTDW